MLKYRKFLPIVEAWFTWFVIVNAKFIRYLLFSLSCKDCLVNTFPHSPFHNFILMPIISKLKQIIKK